MPSARCLRRFALAGLMALVALVSSAAHAQNRSDIWWNPSESGWGLTIADHETQIFAVWYTYREDGSPTWFVIPGGTFSQGRRIFTGDIFQTTGPAYDRPFNPNLVTVTRVGTATIDFSPPGLAAGQALFTYAVGSVSRSKTIERQGFGNAPPNWGTDLTDIWWDPNESGWGLTLAQHGNNIFGVWFTYGTDGRPLFVVMPGATFAGPMSFTGELYTTTGPYYGNPTFDASQVRVQREGTASIAFETLPSSLKQFAPRRGQWNGTFRNSVQFKTLTSQPFGNAAPTEAAPLSIQIRRSSPATPGVFYSRARGDGDGRLSRPYSFSLDSLVHGAPPLGTVIEVDGFLTGTPSSTYTDLAAVPVPCLRVRPRPPDRLRHRRPMRVVPLTTTPPLSVRARSSGTIGNQCNNGETVRYKWHDRENDWVWPSATTLLRRSDFGQSSHQHAQLLPRRPASASARARPRARLSWGVGFGGTGGCTNCCGTCGQGPYTYTFGCPARRRRAARPTTRTGVAAAAASAPR